MALDCPSLIFMPSSSPDPLVKSPILDAVREQSVRQTETETHHPLLAAGRPSCTYIAGALSIFKWQVPSTSSFCWRWPLAPWPSCWTIQRAPGQASLLPLSRPTLLTSRYCEELNLLQVQCIAVAALYSVYGAAVRYSVLTHSRDWSQSNTDRIL